MDKFSVLIPSYKEKERLYNLVKTILKDELRNEIEKIVIVTPDKDLALPNWKKLILIKEKQRKGKYRAIRFGLRKIKSKIIVMLSSDIRMRGNFLRFLLMHFKDKKVGMVVGRPKVEKNSKIYRFSKIIWDLHHLLCFKEPKGTEICAFRKIINNFPKISADEVYVEYKIRKAGYKVIYEPKAYGYTRIPESLKAFFRQRKRIFWGHLHIKEIYKFPTSSLKFYLNLLALICFIKDMRFKDILPLLTVLLLELFARLVATFEFYFTKKSYAKW